MHGRRVRGRITRRAHDRYAAAGELQRAAWAGARQQMDDAWAIFWPCGSRPQACGACHKLVASATRSRQGAMGCLGWCQAATMDCLGWCQVTNSLTCGQYLGAFGHYFGRAVFDHKLVATMQSGLPCGVPCLSHQLSPGRYHTDI